MDIQILSKKTHGTTRWNRTGSYGFAADDALVPLVMRELPRACTVMPIGFAKGPAGMRPVGVMNLQPSGNAFVDAQGQWVADYVPALYRSYPFHLASVDGDTKSTHRLLAVVNDRRVLSETSGQPIYTADRELTPPIQKIRDFLVQIAASEQITQRYCQTLEQYDVFTPWQGDAGSNQPHPHIDGLYRVDEKKFNELPTHAFEAVRKSGGLPMVYCHLISLQHVPKLDRLFKERQAAQTSIQAAAVDGDGDLQFLDDSDTISFDNL